jgi:hypothetical protein
MNDQTKQAYANAFELSINRKHPQAKATHPDQLTAEHWIILRLMREMVGTPAVKSLTYTKSAIWLLRQLSPDCLTKAVILLNTEHD